MRIHILAICGTFMAGMARIARQLGYEVTGSDMNVYPPMSDILENLGIHIEEGYDPHFLQQTRPDVVIIGNAISRGNPSVEYVLNAKIPYQSGPQWLADNVLAQRHVLAVSGTHGKTTTASLLTHVLHQAALEPGYLIGGVAKNFQHTAELGKDRYFVIEADEYDSAFFDKRPKFIHYHPQTLIINNLEYDHADIFPDLESIKRQFQFLIRTIPGNGLIIYPHQDPAIEEVLARGLWTTTETIGGQGTWHAKLLKADGSEFELWRLNQLVGNIKWQMCGMHNVSNALAAASAAHSVGVGAEEILSGLETFRGVKRRMEVRGTINGITVYDDFAHHPTAIATTLAGLRAKIGNERIIAVLEFASQTMRQGEHRDVIADSLNIADRVVMLRPEGQLWNVDPLLTQLGKKAIACDSVSDIIGQLDRELRPKDHVIIMSNKGFDGIHQRLLEKLQLNFSSQS